MKITLTIRSIGGGRIKATPDFKRESNDTPRIGNLGLEIFRELQKMCDGADKVKVEHAK